VKGEEIDKILDVMLGNEQMECVARYLSGGRRLQSLDEATLKQRWIDELWRMLRESEADSVLRQEIFAELSLRGINRVKLPPDLAAIMKQAMGPSPEVWAGLLDEIDAFRRTLAKPKH
jgi:hypothetical protein